LDIVEMPRKVTVQDEGGELDFAIRFGTGSRGCLPELKASAHSHCKVPTRRRKLEGRHIALEGKVVNRNATVEIGQNSSAILVDCEQKISSRCEVEADDVLAVGERKGIRGIARK
jgi:hypothetical protein